MKAILLKILKEKLGNVESDLYLAEQSFSRMTKAELNMEHRDPGSSREDVLNGYKAIVDDVKQCIEWVKNVK